MKTQKYKNKTQGLEEQLARALADYQNLIKRVEREKEEVLAKASKSLVEELLPVLDVLQTAQKHLKDNGLEMAIIQFRQVLERAGVERIGAEPGDRFDENIHEAVDTESGGQKGTIARVATEGYRWRDGSLLRPVKVVVYGEEVEKQTEAEIEKEMLRGDYV